MNLSDAFDRGANQYDRLVGLNPGYHQHLRAAASALWERIGDARPARVVDLACGSGASTRALLDTAGPLGATSITGLDASAGMLRRARNKSWPPGIVFRQAVIGELDPAPYTGSDGALACYLFRNVDADRRDRAVAEVFELLRPGGWLVAQEYSVRGNRGAALRWDAVCASVIIPLGTVVDANPGLYTYLRRSVHEFDSVEQFCARLSGAGFVDVAHRTVAGWQHDILHTFVARRPGGDA